MGVTVLDAGVLIGFLDANDTHHAAAHQAFADARDRGDSIMMPASAFAASAAESFAAFDVESKTDAEVTDVGAAAAAAGFAAVEAHLAALGRPPVAFAACELRSPAPFTEHGFKEFNIRYSRTLERWGLWRDGDNAVGRSNVLGALPVSTSCACCACATADSPVAQPST